MNGEQLRGVGKFLLSWVTFLMVVSIYVLVFVVGNPPRQCRYLVPLKDHPGVYACSAEPKARP